MKSAFITAVLAGMCLQLSPPAARAQAQKADPPARKSADDSLSATLDWMAQTYSFTEGRVVSSTVAIHSKQTDASLTHEGCRLTVKQKDVIFETAPAGRTDTSIWKRVIDLGRLDPKSIQLRSVSDPGKLAHFVLDFASAGGYKNIEIYFAEGAEPAHASHGSILLFAGHNDYAARFDKAFRHAVELCARQTTP